jgi:hypothetical protein
VYDYHNELMYISNAGVSDGEGGSGEPAYDRPYAKIHMKDMWNEPRPTN